MKKVAILIPVYQSDITFHEETSFRQCLKVLHNYDIYIITYRELQTTLYDSICNEYSANVQYKYFSKDYFKSISGYNKLCLNKELYISFKEYEYILIYQLDAWVFYDRLTYWCNKNYDYIGAPWFEEYGYHEEGKKLWAVGNGGLSLRKVKYFTKILSWKLPIIKPKLKNILNIHFLLFYLGRHNTISFYNKSINTNEDYFFSQYLSQSWFPPSVPNCDEALYFSFEKSPSYLFIKARHQLPFGCHAYLKNEYDTFWHKYIKL